MFLRPVAFLRPFSRRDSLLFQHFDYMPWAKTAPDASVRWNLASSGFSYTDPAIISPDFFRVELFSPRGYGYPAVRACVSRRYGIPEDHILPAAGTSLGIFMAMAAVLEPGDEVLVERPAYEPLFKVPLSLGAAVRRFDRGFEQRFEIDPDRLRREITPKTRVIALTDLHNPSGRTMSEDVRRELKRLASEAGITLLVDEVSRDFVDGGRPATIYEPGSPVVVTSSLTKVYGMGGLRAGWIMASPDIVAKATAVMNLLQVNDPYAMVPIIEAAFDHADELRRKGIEVSRAGLGALAEWLGSRSDVEYVLPDAGLVAFPRLPAPLTGSEVSSVLKRDEATLVVPGRFFEDDRHIRIGVAAGPEVVREGLVRLGQVIDRLRAR